jgi:hypothetical protein
MTMPKFEPVAHIHQHDETGRIALREMPERMNEIRWIEIPLYTAGQLTETYAAGKRDAIPEGWVLVPKEPTAELLSFVIGLIAPGIDTRVDNYKAMIAAAPKGEE